MEKGLKERLVGAAVLVILGVIFIPVFLDNQKDNDLEISGSNIPPMPDNMPSISDKAGIIKHIESSIPEPTEEESATDTAKLQSRNTTEDKDGNKMIPDKVIVSAWVIQVGSFGSQENAEDLNKDLRKAGFRSFIEPLRKNGKTTYRVRIGPELKRSDAEATRDKVKKEFKLEGILLKYP